MCVVESEVSCQDLRSRGINSARSRAEVKDGVVESQSHLKVLGSLAEEVGYKEDLPTAGRRKSSDRQRPIQPAAGHAQSNPPSAGTFPRDTGLRYVRFPPVHQTHP